MKKISLIVFVLAISVFNSSAKAQVGKTYEEGLVTEITYIKVEYGHMDDYVKWLTSTWKPLREEMKKTGLIADYKVFSMRPKSPAEPNVIFMITYKDMAGLDKAAEEEAIAGKIIGSAEVQDRARVERNEYRTILGSELIRELILK